MDIRTGNVLLNRNVQLTRFLIEGLIRKNITGIYVYDSLSSGVRASLSLPIALRIKLAQSVNSLNIDDVCYLTSEMREELMAGDKIIKTNLEDLGNYDARTYMHSTNVATYSGIIGLKMGYGIEELKNLMSAALLHDIGKEQIDPKIIRSKKKLSKEERAEINKHTIYGYEMVRDEYISATIKVAILDHHENWDGSGYPRGLEGEDIHKFARIIHVADIYDAMISKRSYKEAVNPVEVLEYIQAHSYDYFEKEVVDIFLENVQPYPEGTEVILSTDEIAIVKENNMKYPSRPVVRYKNGKDVDLTETLNVTIKSVNNYSIGV